MKISVWYHGSHLAYIIYVLAYQLATYVSKYFNIDLGFLSSGGGGAEQAINTR
jgi:hypothetical protein